jgi:hypothetical protein
MVLSWPARLRKKRRERSSVHVCTLSTLAHVLIKSSNAVAFLQISATLTALTGRMADFSAITSLPHDLQAGLVGIKVEIDAIAYLGR